MATTHTRLVTFAEFERLPNPLSGRLELRHGELVQLAPPQHKHYLVQRRLRKLLEEAAGSAGEAGTEFAFRAQPEYEYRVADVAFISKTTWNRIPLDGILAGAPELVIEVLSPSNTEAEILDKKTLCLAIGSREFWIVDIDRRRVEVSTAGGGAVTYNPGQAIPLFFAPDSSIAVDAIFS